MTHYSFKYRLSIPPSLRILITTSLYLLYSSIQKLAAKTKAASHGSNKLCLKSCSLPNIPSALDFVTHRQKRRIRRERKISGTQLRVLEYIESIEPFSSVSPTNKWQANTQLSIIISPLSMVHATFNSPKNFLEDFEASCQGGSPRRVILL